MGIFFSLQNVYKILKHHQMNEQFEVILLWNIISATMCEEMVSLSLEQTSGEITVEI